jgi:hypothetical protein
MASLIKFTARGSVLPDKTLNKSSKEAHIWHTTLCQDLNQRSVLEELSLIKQISVCSALHGALRTWKFSGFSAGSVGYGSMKA